MHLIIIPQQIRRTANLVKIGSSSPDVMQRIAAEPSYCRLDSTGGPVLQQNKNERDMQLLNSSKDHARALTTLSRSDDTLGIDKHHRIMMIQAYK